MADDRGGALEDVNQSAAYMILNDLEKDGKIAPEK